MLTPQTSIGYPAASLAERLCAILDAHPGGLEARRLAALGSVTMERLPRLLATPIAARRVRVEQSGDCTVFRSHRDPQGAGRQHGKHGRHAAEVERIMAALRAQPQGITTSALARESGADRNNVDWLLRKQIRDGAVVRGGFVTEQTRAGRRQVRVWRLVDAAEALADAATGAAATEGGPPEPEPDLAQDLAQDLAPALLGDPTTQAIRLRLLADNHLREREYSEVRGWLHALSDEIQQLQVVA